MTSARPHPPGPTTPAAARALALRVFRPPPDVPGLKLDWYSAVGTTGVLLDWTTGESTVDDGVPPDVAPVLARGLCALATVTACTPRIPRDVGERWAAVPGGAACRLAGGWFARPRTIPLLATQNPVEVARFFDEDEFVWASEGQALFLSPADVPPALTRAIVDAVLARPLAVTPDALRAASVTGLVLPGVDGDMAGLYVCDTATRDALLAALAAAARAAGARWEERGGGEHWSMRADRDRS